MRGGVNDAGVTVLLWKSVKAVRGAFEAAAGVEEGKKGR